MLFWGDKVTHAHALPRLGLSKKQQDFWSVQLERAIDAHKHAHSCEQRQASLGTGKVYYELNQFYRSLSRRPRLATIICNWKRLHEADQIFAKKNLKIDNDVVKSFDDLTLDNFERQGLFKNGFA